MMGTDWKKIADDLLDAWLATWMAARAEVEGARTARELFEKEPEVIAYRAAIAGNK